jgi:hypothetical protein
MAISLNTVLEKIESEHTEIAEREKKQLKNFLTPNTNFDSVIYFYIRTHNADQYEAKFKVLARVLDYFKQNHPEEYKAAILEAISKTKEYCLSNRENKIALFAQTLVDQFRNIEVEFVNEYFDKLFGCAYKCLEMTHSTEQDLKESREWSEKFGGEVEFYNKRLKHPLHVIADSARIGLDYFVDFFVQYLRQNTNLKEITIEQTIILFVDNCLRDLKKDDEPFRTDFKLENFIQSFMVKWESQYLLEQNTFKEVNDNTSLPNAVTALTISYLFYESFSHKNKPKEEAEEAEPASTINWEFSPAGPALTPGFSSAVSAVSISASLSLDEQFGTPSQSVGVRLHF